jgi:hypothetical protein
MTTQKTTTDILTVVEGTEENHEKPQPGQPAYETRFELRTSLTRSGSASQSAATFDRTSGEVFGSKTLETVWNEFNEAYTKIKQDSWFSGETCTLTASVCVL